MSQKPVFITPWFAVYLLVYSVTAHPAQHWGDFKADQCTGIGIRQFSAILWNIPWGRSWEDACKAMPADIRGQHFNGPARCKKTTNMWGEFDVKDDSCLPH